MQHIIVNAVTKIYKAAEKKRQNVVETKMKNSRKKELFFLCYTCPSVNPSALKSF